MDSEGWLSTKNKKKIQKLPQRIKKTRTSTLKVSSPLQFTQSAPPKQLFTSTKQTSLNDFFSSNAESQLEVEVIFDHDIQSQRPTEQDKYSHCSSTFTTNTSTNELSEMKTERGSSIEEVTEYNSDTDNVVRNHLNENPEEKLPCDNSSAFNVQFKENKKSSHNGIEKRDKFCLSSHKNLTDNVAVVSESKNARLPLKRLQCTGDSNVDIDNPFKRIRLEFPVINENDLKLNERNIEPNMDDLDKSYNRIYGTNIDITTEDISENQQIHGSTLENDADVVSSDLAFSGFTSQSLDLGSQLSLNMSSQDTELSSLTCTELETQNVLIKAQKDDSSGCNINISYKAQLTDKINGVEDKSKDVDMFTLTYSQLDTTVDKSENSVDTIHRVNDDIDTFTLTDSQTETNGNPVDRSGNLLKDDTIDNETLTLIDSQCDILAGNVCNVTSPPSLDLSSESQSFDIVTETNNTLYSPASSTDYSQITDSGPECLSLNFS